MEYDYIAFPFDFDSFDNISKKQAREYFKWYISQSEIRIDLLRAFIRENRSERIKLNNSPESLVPLWKWFEDEILFSEHGLISEWENDSCNADSHKKCQSFLVILPIDFS